MLARDRPPGLPGLGHLAPAGGPSLALAPWLPSLLCPLPCLPRAPWSGSVSPGSGCPGRAARLPRLPLAARHPGAPGAWPLLLSAPPHSLISVSAHFAPFLAPFASAFGSWPAVTICAVLQPSSLRSPILRSPSRTASPGSWAVQALAAPLSPLPPPQLPRHLWPRPPRLCKHAPARLLQRP